MIAVVTATCRNRANYCRISSDTRASQLFDFFFQTCVLRPILTIQTVVELESSLILVAWIALYADVIAPDCSAHVFDSALIPVNEANVSDAGRRGRPAVVRALYAYACIPM